MNTADDKEHAFIAKFALVLFIAGLLLPFPIAAGVLASAGRYVTFVTVNTAVSLAFGWCFIAEILALVFGIVGRRLLSGKIAMDGAVIALALAVAVTVAYPYVFFDSRHPGRGLPPRPKAIPSTPEPQQTRLLSPRPSTSSEDSLLA